ncbi:FACT complex subunit SSRP1 [Nesidiocoris tenuis]|uniref:Odorant receptor n=1 Tax=Nesidiocoris tenuis TaxID=355587 RepID=A0ABN7B3Y6_9HEMI|nr:FACT complex subunit SSRP1 [Nesidiocoris tenuis]
MSKIVLPKITKPRQRHHVKKSVKKSSPKFEPSNGDEEVFLSAEAAYQKGFAENQGLFMLLGAFYRNSAISWIHFLTFLLSASFLSALFFQTAFLFKDNLARLYETLHWIVIIVGMIVQVLVYTSVKSPYDRIFTKFGNTLYKYEITDDETASEINRLRKRGDWEKSLICKVFTGMLYSLSVCFGLFLPVIDIITGEFFTPQQSNGILTGIPCIIWVPYTIDPNSVIIARVIILVWQMYMGFTIINSIIALETTAICIGHRLFFEFQILAKTLNRFEIRAQAAFKKSIENGNETSISQDDFYCLSLRDSVKHHHTLLEIAGDYMAIFFYPEVVVLVGSIFVICLSALSIVSDIPLMAKAVFIVFTLSELANVFVLCYYGQILNDAHEMVDLALYDSNWTNHIRQVRHHVIIMSHRLRIPLTLTAAGFVPANLITFTQVVKSAFSYFNILQALKS